MKSLVGGLDAGAAAVTAVAQDGQIVGEEWVAAGIAVLGALGLTCTQRLVAERDKAEADQAKVEAGVGVLEPDVPRLRLLVTQFGGTP
ncbi:hypothetical protein [Streptomyces acidicola]|uniref:hypothetical protein n=1 Tax=Streptomyces acidicola TaxID=2596892 RepID=UPI003808E462